MNGYDTLSTNQQIKATTIQPSRAGKEYCGFGRQPVIALDHLPVP